MANVTIQSIEARRFKGIESAILDPANINVFIGANNSGKSTLAQLIHFGIGLLQSVNLEGKLGSGTTASLSLSPQQLLYSPCADLYALGYGGQLTEAIERAVTLSVALSNGEQITIQVRRGRNGNVRVHLDNVPAARAISELESPFTIYSPGLAGIARVESHISNGVLLRTIARGDANLVLRNILLRLADENHQQAWEEFMDDLRRLFPGIEILVHFREESDEHISVSTNTGGGSVPIELTGTGVLQAIQILGYVHYFHPSVIILDEPDSHLHPNNQRLLCQLLLGVAEDRQTQVFLTTHSRHVVDALNRQAAFYWLRNGTAERMNHDQDLEVLLDIGALDVTEMLSKSNPKLIVLTEDTNTRGVDVLLRSSGVNMDEGLTLSYHGCTTPQNLRPLLDLIRTSNAQSRILVHRDRDYLTDKESQDWATAIRKRNAHPFLTSGVDVEAHLLNPHHIAALNAIEVDEAESLVRAATQASHRASVEKYVNGRVDIEKKQGTYGALNVGELAAEADQTVRSNSHRFRHGKTVLKALRKEYQDRHGSNLRIFEVSEHLRVSDLAVFARDT